MCYRMILRRVVATLIGFLPLNLLRVAFYRLVFGYKIAKSAKIGFGTVIAIDSMSLGASRIGRFNAFVGPFVLTIGDGTAIGPQNTFFCGSWALEGEYATMESARTCTIGSRSMITRGHFIDVAGGFHLGNGSWIAGYASQFWTHGAEASGQIVSIVIGDGNYIGSAVRFAPGSGIADRTIVGLGSVVTKRFTQSDVMIAGVPARVIKEGYYFRDHMANPHI
jgi:acetyltransferase-like isoleucine patch superfamily enzyme